MSDSSKNANVYMELIKVLREVIESDYQEGGWLPSGRKMARQLNVGYSTYRKAIDFLEREGLVEGEARRGHYVYPKLWRPRKVGIVLDGGKENPFVHDKKLVAKAFERLNKAGFGAQILQGSSIEMIGQNAASYAVEGIIWFFPTPSSEETIERFEDETGIPVVVVSFQPIGQAFPKFPLITYNSRQSLRRRFSTMIGRGHKKLLYIGNFKHVRQSGVERMLAKLKIKFSEEQCFLNLWKNPRKLLRTLKKTRATGIISEGKFLDVKCLFETLSELPETDQPELYVTYFSRLGSLYRYYSKIKLVGNLKRPKRNLGELAAKMMIDHLEKGKSLEQIKIMGEC